jgi:periplasmic divalent cation tolerance protein
MRGESDGAGITLVLTTAPDVATAEGIVEALVEERLAACGNVLPGVRSIYRWEGSIERADEVLVLLKVPVDGVGKVFARLPELHPYSVPEVVEVPIASVSDAYRKWVIECTEGSR